MEIGGVQETEFGGDRTSTGDWVWWRSGEYRRLSLMKIGRVQETEFGKIGGVQETDFGGDRGSTGD